MNFSFSVQDSFEIILIESQWNLNDKRAFNHRKQRRILIESQWNLN